MRREKNLKGIQIHMINVLVHISPQIAADEDRHSDINCIMEMSLQESLVNHSAYNSNQNDINQVDKFIKIVGDSIAFMKRSEIG